MRTRQSTDSTARLGASTTSAVLAAILAAACGPTNTGTIGPGGDGVDGNGGPGSVDARPGGGEFIDAAICNQTTPIKTSMMPATPDMLFILDNSGSMADPISSTSTMAKVDVVKGAMNTLIPATNAAIHWGLMDFPSDGQCGAGTILVGVAANNGTAVLNALSPLTPNGLTPTPPSLDAARTYFGGIAINPSGRYVLLATDGEPNCDGGTIFGGDTSTQAVAAVTALAAAGIKTFVIGVGDVSVSNPTTLMQMAVAGGTGMFYPAESPAALQNALNVITGGISTASCTYMLETTPPDVSKLAVTLDGTAVPRDPSHMTGWDYDAATNSITFYGGQCSSIQSGMAHAVGVDYGCGGPMVGKPSP